MHKFDKKFIYPESKKSVRRDSGGSDDFRKAKKKKKKRKRLLTVERKAEKGKEGKRGTEGKVQGTQDPDCAEQGTVFFSL